MDSDSDLYIVSGAMGAGKSTVLHALAAQGVAVAPEPARQILAEQRLIASSGVPEQDPGLFTQLMLSRATHQHQSMRAIGKVVVMDRGVPDMIAYAMWFGLDPSAYWRAAAHYRCNQQVFFLPAWEAIYQTDDERKMSFEQAHAFGESLRSIYHTLEYTLVEVPPLAVEDRAGFILKHVGLN